MTSQWQQSDPDGPSEADIERFASELKQCPECAAEVYDQAEICSACNHAFDGIDTPKGIPVWAYALAFMLVVVLLLFGTIL